jgi:uncharacterized repeat protein (TIGR01451 family)
MLPLRHTAPPTLVRRRGRERSGGRSVRTRSIARALFLLAALLALAPRPASALTVRSIALHSNDLVFNPSDGFVYASLGSSDSMYPNTIAKINPSLAQVVATLRIGFEPRKLALTSDGSRLYVGLDSTGSIRRVDLAGFTAGTEFSLGSDPFLGTLYAEDIDVQPGNNDVLAVALRNQGFSPRHMGVAIFDHGVARPNRTADHLGSNTMVFSSVPTRLYGQNLEFENGFRRMDVDANGVTVLDVTTDILYDGGRELVLQDGLIYSAGGTVIDPEARTRLRVYSPIDGSYPTAVAVDPSFVYYATYTYSGAIGVHILERGSFSPIFRYTIPGASLPTAMYRWGADGLAIRSEYGPVLILSDVFTPPQCDLAITKHDFADPVPLNDLIHYRISVVNQGLATAENISVRDLLPALASFESAFSTRGFTYDSSGTLVCMVPSLGPGEAFDIYLDMRPIITGFITNRAYVASATPDADTSNGTAIEQTEVVPIGANQADIYLEFVHPPAVVGVEGEFIEQAIVIGNHGPATAHDAMFSAYAYGAPYTMEVVSGGGATCTTYPGAINCVIGTLPSGGTVNITVHIGLDGAGFLYPYYALYASGNDPDYSNNYLYTAIQVLPSAPRLLDSLAIQTQLLGLKNGPEKIFLRQIGGVKAALAVRDTGTACSMLADFQAGVARRAGRALDLDQAFGLFVRTRLIQQVLGCIPPDGGGDSLTATQHAPPPPGDDPNNLPMRRATPGNSIPTRLELITYGRGSQLAPLLAMPAPGRARLEVLDVQGRIVATLFDGTLPAGTHAMSWRGGTPGSGLYFYRLSALGKQIVTKVSIVK